MSPKPHSKTVRGTLDNPKTKEAMQSNKPTPQLGDATSLKPEASEKSLPSNDSAPPPGQGNDNPSSSAPSNSDKNSKDDAITTRKLEMVNKENGGKDLPHSKKVRGTLANSDGKKLNKTQLGDPTSLSAETHESEMKKGAEGAGQDKSGKSKL